MDTKQALAIATKLRGHYESFKQLEELLTFATQVETLIAEREIQSEAIRKEIVQVTKERDEIVAVVKAKKAELDKLIAAKRKEMETLVSESTAAIIKERVAAKESMDKFLSESEATKTFLKNEIAAFQTFKIDLEKQVVAVQAQLDSIKIKVNNILGA